MRIWLQKAGVDRGAANVFLALRSDQQEAVRRVGWLGDTNPSAERIREMFGYVDLKTMMTSDKRSRSPEFRRRNSLMEEFHHGKGAGKGSAEYGIGRAENVLGATEHAQRGSSEAEHSKAAYISRHSVASRKDLHYAESFDRGRVEDTQSRAQPIHACTCSSSDAAEHVQRGVAAARSREDFQYVKGAGKGSRGNRIRFPQSDVLPAEDLALLMSIWATNERDIFRKGTKLSARDIGAWVQDDYREIVNPWKRNVTELCYGMNCLWKRTSGDSTDRVYTSGESTNVVHSSGNSHGWADHEWVYVTQDAVAPSITKIHFSYLLAASEDWLVAEGGRA
jgi:hypothetical protein